ncbi:hypothetical protein FBU59_004259 [Linderina macrospora]|uniref:Uncharacterized protein n=1 Tax=Linderina macrospora TaxID=4868 RepID=A0ACC1J629_9FUNG|nr:hypothetical protein FBU59_004259 [Linderina macrospora]
MLPVASATNTSSSSALSTICVTLPTLTSWRFVRSMGLVPLGCHPLTRVSSASAVQKTLIPEGVPAMV